MEIRWVRGQGKDVVRIKKVEVELNEEEADKVEENVDELKQNDDYKKNINHYSKYQHIWVEFEYINEPETERLDFHPTNTNSEILSWKIVSSNPIFNNMLNTDDTDLKLDELDDELCSVCCTPFKEFPYRTVVPCAHNDVCAKCTLRMRYFGDFSNIKHPYPMCPFCKESWQTVAFIPLSWSIVMQHGGKSMWKFPANLEN